ncbi:TPA: hypothetical protein KEV35_003290 [Escherichia coli]|nr:hypothetical protein [Escherichia coli]
MLQMKFKPCFIDAFRNRRKTTSLRPMGFECYSSDHYASDTEPVEYFHEDTLTRNITLPDYSAGGTLIFEAGTTFTRASDFAGLLKRQPYRLSDNIHLVTENKNGETVPFAVAFIANIDVIQGRQITDEMAVRDGFNPENNPRGELFAFMQDICHIETPGNETYWRYTFTHVVMLSQWRADA